MSQFISEFKSIEDVANRYGRGDYGCSESDPTEEAILAELSAANVLIAWYGYGCYCGSSFVLYEKDGKLWRVDGGHCSCCGLEGQWEPIETDWATLRNEVVDGYRFDNEYDEGETAREALKRLIDERDPR